MRINRKETKRVYQSVTLETIEGELEDFFIFENIAHPPFRLNNRWILEFLTDILDQNIDDIGLPNIVKIPNMLAYLLPT